jgi:hypothetical protein
MAKDPMLEFMVRGLMAGQAGEVRGVCAKCRRVFQSASEKRWAAGLKAFICRDARGCRAREAERVQPLS